MITSPEEYFKHLWGLQITDENGNIVNPYNNRPLLSVILPSEEKTFDVDLNTRTILVPTFLSVAKDHRAETVYFRVDRYYKYKDLANTSCMIEFINANGEGGFYPVPFYDITSYPGYFDEEDKSYDAKMLIPWCIEGDVTKTAGNVQFILRFYELDESNTKFIYNLRTSIATATVLTGLDDSIISNSIDVDQTANLIEQVNYKLDNVQQTIYWTDLSNYSISYNNVTDSGRTSDVNDYLNSL